MVALHAQRYGLSPYRYAATRTPADLAIDNEAWASTWLIPVGSVARMLFGAGGKTAAPGSGSGSMPVPQNSAAAGAPVYEGLPPRFNWVRTRRGATVRFVDLDNLTREHFGDAVALTKGASRQHSDQIPEELRRLKTSRVWAKVKGSFSGDG